MRALFLHQTLPDTHPLIKVDIQYATQSKILPSAQQLHDWVNGACATVQSETMLTLRIVDSDEMTQLNHHYRGKNQPTNVLSFPFTPEPHVPEQMLGDIVICAPVVFTEASAQQKSWVSHFAHLVVHGCLHLLAFDHENESDAQVMESLEVQILAGLGFSNPYIKV